MTFAIIHAMYINIVSNELFLDFVVVFVVVVVVD